MSVDVGSARVAFRERPLVDVLDLALRFLVVHGRAYSKLALAVLLPSFALCWAAAAAAGWTVGLGVAVALSLLVEVPFTLLAARLVFEREPRTAEVLRAAVSHLPGLLLLRAVWATTLVLGLAMFLVPAAWVGAVFLFTDEVLLLERAPPLSALSRAQRLASASGGTALLATFLFFVVRAAAVALAEVGGRALLSELLQIRPPEGALSAGGSVLCLAGILLAVPYVATARLLTYLDVRTRAEGWDVQTRFAALAARAERDAATTEAR